MKATCNVRGEAFTLISEGGKTELFNSNNAKVTLTMVMEAHSGLSRTEQIRRIRATASLAKNAVQLRANLRKTTQLVWK